LAEHYVGVKIEPLPRVAAWRETLRERPACRRALVMCVKFCCARSVLLLWYRGGIFDLFC
jgi:hypothetical protein